MLDSPIANPTALWLSGRVEQYQYHLRTRLKGLGHAILGNFV